MNTNLKKNLDNYFNERNDYIGGKVPMNEILLAEKNLNLSFSDSYKKFLQEYGGVLLNGYTINGLRKTMLMDIDLWSVIQNTLFYKEKQQWPGIDDWYIISDDGRGNPIGCKPDGSVWLSDHDAGFEQIKLADNFEQFLEKILNDTLYD